MWSAFEMVFAISDLRSSIGRNYITIIRDEIETMFKLTMTVFSGGYYLIEQKMKKLQIVVLNTNLLIGREGRDGRQDPIDDEAKRMWDWLDTILAKCLVNRETVSTHFFFKSYICRNSNTN